MRVLYVCGCSSPPPLSSPQVHAQEGTNGNPGPEESVAATPTGTKDRAAREVVRLEAELEDARAQLQAETARSTALQEALVSAKGEVKEKGLRRGGGGKGRNGSR